MPNWRAFFTRLRTAATRLRTTITSSIPTDWRARLTRLRAADTAIARKLFTWRNLRIALAITALCLLLALLLTLVFSPGSVLTAFGFGSAGIVAGSVAAALQGPAVAAGSWFAVLQSAGMGGAALCWLQVAAGMVTAWIAGGCAGFWRRV